jgi:hypothetical protein
MFVDSKPKNLNFKIIWLDKNAGSSWTFCYKSPEGIKNALQPVTGIGDNQWKTVTFTISDAVLDKSGRFGSDCMLVNTDNTDDIFNSIEVGIERELSTGIVTNTMTKDLNVTVFPNPANSIINIKSIHEIKCVEICDLSGKSKEVIAKDIELIQDAAVRGKIVIAKAWPKYNFTNEQIKSMSQEQLETMSREDIVFPLATFLVGAGKYAYFCYSWGYDYKQGGMIDYPEYNKPLGEPMGAAKKDGFIYTREFKNASVYADIENRIGKITWK